MSVNNEDEEEAYSTKLRVEGVVEKDVYEDFKRVYELECEAPRKATAANPAEAKS